MKKPEICAVIVDHDLAAIRPIEELVDRVELRIDLIGEGWQNLVGKLNKPWIATNRRAEEAGKWRGSETSRIDELLKAVALGAEIIDLELETKELNQAIELVKKRANCLVSFHDLIGTPPLFRLKEIVRQELAMGADICKVVTTAQKFEDNASVLELISAFPKARIISFAMGSLGIVSRALCPLVGGYFTYASIEAGKESASGQITVSELRKIYKLLFEC